MKFFNRKPTKIINKPDLSKLDNLFAQIPSNFAPTPTAKSMKATRPSTPILDHMLKTPSAAAKPGVNVTSSTTAPAAVPSSTAPTESENRIAAAVLQMLQKSIPAPATGLHGLLEKARAKHTAELDAKMKKEAHGPRPVQNSHLKGMARLLANAQSKDAPSSKAPNAPVRI